MTQNIQLTRSEKLTHLVMWYGQIAQEVPGKIRVNLSSTAPVTMEDFLATWYHLVPTLIGTEDLQGLSVTFSLREWQKAVAAFVPPINSSSMFAQPRLSVETASTTSSMMSDTPRSHQDPETKWLTVLNGGFRTAMERLSKCQNFHYNASTQHSDNDELVFDSAQEAMKISQHFPRLDQTAPTNSNRALIPKTFRPLVRHYFQEQNLNLRETGCCFSLWRCWSSLFSCCSLSASANTEHELEGPLLQE